RPDLRAVRQLRAGAVLGPGAAGGGGTPVSRRELGRASRVRKGCRGVVSGRPGRGPLRARGKPDDLAVGGARGRASAALRERELSGLPSPTSSRFRFLFRSSKAPRRSPAGWRG